MTRIVSQPDHGNKLIDKEGLALSNFQIFIDDVVRQFNLLETLVSGVQSISGPGVIDLATGLTEITTTGADDFTLADGFIGQIKRIILVANGGDAKVTPANLNGGATLTFNADGENIILLFSSFSSPGSWNIIVNNGVLVT